MHFTEQEVSAVGLKPWYLLLVTKVGHLILSFCCWVCDLMGQTLNWLFQDLHLFRPHNIPLCVMTTARPLTYTQPWYRWPWLTHMLLRPLCVCCSVTIVQELSVKGKFADGCELWSGRSGALEVRPWKLAVLADKLSSVSLMNHSRWWNFCCITALQL